MKKRVRLYRKIDADLITLYKHPRFSLQKAMLSSLRMWSKGECQRILLPEPYILHELPLNVEFTLNIPDDDIETIAFLHGIPAGTRNDALKNMIRNFLAGPVVYAYIKDAESSKVIVDQYNSRDDVTMICFKRERDAIKEANERLIQTKKVLGSSKSAEKISKLIKENEEKNIKEFFNEEIETKKPLKKETKANIETKITEKETEEIKPNTSEPEVLPIRQILEEELDDFDEVAEITPNINEEKADENKISYENNVINYTNSSKISYNTNEDNNADDDFDLFGAVNSMMSSM